MCTISISVAKLSSKHENTTTMVMVLGHMCQDDEVREVGIAVMVTVVVSSIACLRVCLGLIIVLKSELQRRGQGGRWPVQLSFVSSLA